MILEVQYIQMCVCVGPGLKNSTMHVHTNYIHNGDKAVSFKRFTMNIFGIIFNVLALTRSICADLVT